MISLVIVFMVNKKMLSAGLFLLDTIILNIIIKSNVTDFQTLYNVPFISHILTRTREEIRSNHKNIFCYFMISLIQLKAFLKNHFDIKSCFQHNCIVLLLSTFWLRLQISIIVMSWFIIWSFNCQKIVKKSIQTPKSSLCCLIFTINSPKIFNIDS